jgi:hypothetical protein
MIPLVFERGPWTAADRANLQSFLQTQTGQRAIAQVMYSRPEYKTFTSIEERAITSAKVEGYETAVSGLLKLQTDQDHG